ncbi:Enoyl-[acyl-carrier-protein] reductase [NADH] [Cardamine amara subsp. amara]|uniref:Enoyl-[acyl-carrier-protein] reductase [NADH], chloroplastic n=1 Tax=Cardamine amara subsp. amara TaxID=228776 RepID=A0ABD1APB8_CARAN
MSSKLLSLTYHYFTSTQTYFSLSDSNITEKISKVVRMAATASSLQIATRRPNISSSSKVLKAGSYIVGVNPVNLSWDKLTSTRHLSNLGCLRNQKHNAVTTSKRPFSFSTKAMSESSENKASSGLPIDLRGKRAFIAGIADDNGYGWAIAKSLAAAGAEILVGTWVPALNIFETSLRRGKFDQSRALPDGSLMEIKKVYALDAVFDNPEDVPEDIKANKRYAGSSNWTVQEAAECVKKDFGSIDILVHSLANGPEVSKPLLETSRKGYLAAISASSYSFVSLLRHFLPIMNPGGASISLTYIASERIIPGYGGGMSSAKAALESDTRVLAFEAGRKQNIRVNTISAGPLGSRAAKAIGFIDTMIEYSYNNGPIQKTLTAEEVGNAAAFLASPLASAITGATIYVDNGLNAMGVALDSPVFKDLNKN